MIPSGQIENHFQSLALKVEEAKVGVLAQLAQQVESFSFVKPPVLVFTGRFAAPSTLRPSATIGDLLV